MLWSYFIPFLALLTNVVQIGSIYNKTIETNNLKITVMKLETDDLSNSDPIALNPKSGRRNYRDGSTLDPMINPPQAFTSTTLNAHLAWSGDASTKGIMTPARPPAGNPSPETDTSTPTSTTTMANSLEGKGWLDPAQFTCCVSYSDTSEPNKTCNQDPSVSYHVMLLYQVDRLGLFCSNYEHVLKQKMADYEKFDCLNLQNKYRMKVANGLETGKIIGLLPKAANMREFAWDYVLEILAQRWADQCVFSLDKCRDLMRFTAGVGQIVVVGPYDYYDLGKVHDVMFDGVNVFGIQNVTTGLKDRSNEKDNFYAQLIWAETYRIGCGRNIIWTSKHQATELLVCNYGPTGYIPTLPIYNVGEPASACPEGTTPSEEYKGLCKELLGNGTDNPAPLALSELRMEEDENAASKLIYCPFYTFLIILNFF